MNQTNGTLEALYALVGPRAVLLPCGLRTKVPIDHRIFGEKRKDGSRDPGWQNTTFERTQEPDYQEQLAAAVERGGNIGVLLGPASGGLVAQDIDNDQGIEEWLVLNPKLAHSLRTKGERGGQIWMRMLGPYPQRVVKLFRNDGTPWGEWRGGGQSIIWGIHPHKMPYQIVTNRPPAELR
jgi:hypothetical protein